ncbi:MAG TPA: SulP family inorganic anion transporter, partial [Phnomibacter sp.]|nr:SulP family inorganic anion transporter [Phnomibacter sp.]
MKAIFRNAGADFPAAIVVFLVALPLCLGVAVASDAAPITGIIAGVVGGVVIGFLSGSPLSVSGPAAGLTAIVASALAKLGSYETFLLSVVLAGALQFGLGMLKAGMIGDFIPNAVIKGMLAAIGLILILKQIPHFVGYDANPEGDESFLQADQENTFSELFNAMQYLSVGATTIGIVSVAILLFFDSKIIKHNPVLRFVPGPLVVVVAGILINEWFKSAQPTLALMQDHLVNLNIFDSTSDFFGALPSPSFSSIAKPQVWITAFTIAIVASLESLLSIEAVDKLDPEKRIT